MAGADASLVRCVDATVRGGQSGSFSFVASGILSGRAGGPDGRHHASMCVPRTLVGIPAGMEAARKSVERDQWYMQVQAGPAGLGSGRRQLVVMGMADRGELEATGEWGGEREPGDVRDDADCEALSKREAAAAAGRLRTSRKKRDGRKERKTGLKKQIAQREEDPEEVELVRRQRVLAGAMELLNKWDEEQVEIWGGEKRGDMYIHECIGREREREQRERTEREKHKGDEIPFWVSNQATAETVRRLHCSRGDTNVNEGPQILKPEH